MKAIVVNKVNGEVKNLREVGQQLRLFFNDATNGEYHLIFEKVKKSRTRDQNKLMWVWFNCIAKSWAEATQMGFTAQNVHDAYCQIFLPISTPHGNIPGHTKNLTTEQFTEFLNKVQADAASEYGITLLSTNDPMYELWARQYQ